MTAGVGWAGDARRPELLGACAVTPAHSYSHSLSSCRWMPAWHSHLCCHLELVTQLPTAQQVSKQHLHDTSFRSFIIGSRCSTPFKITNDLS